MLKAQGITVEYTFASERITSIKEWVVRSLQGKKRGGRRIVALDGVDFEVGPGDCFGLIGHNGSGKSTLLKVLSGVLSPRKGTVTYQGRMTSLIELGAGFDPELTGRENIRLCCALTGLDAKETEDSIPGIIAFSELGEFIEQPVKNYSSGMQARLGFACATAVNPDIMLIDEALAVGDEAFQKKCLQRLDTLRSLGRSIVLVSHDLNAVEKYCNRVCLLHKGKVDFLGNAREGVEIFRSQLLRALAEGRSMVGATIHDVRGENIDPNSSADTGHGYPGENAADAEKHRTFVSMVAAMSGMVHDKRLNFLQFGKPWKANLYVDEDKLAAFEAAGGSKTVKARIDILEGKAGLRMASWNTTLTFGAPPGGTPSLGKREALLRFSTCPFMPGRYIVDLEVPSPVEGKPPVTFPHLVSFEVLATGDERANEGSLVPLGLFHELP